MIFEEFNDRVLGISSEIEQYTTNGEILYKTSVNFVALALQKNNNRIRILLRTKNNLINDPKNITEIVPKNFDWGNLSHIVYLSPQELNKKYIMEDVLDLVIQSYKTTQ